MNESNATLPGAYELELAGQHILLLPEKALFWLEESILIISDLHMGKAGHFRKAGIPISGKVHIEELFLLDALISELYPKKLLFLGDLFHSHWNLEWPLFSNWLTNYRQLESHLVIGNHDILSKLDYKSSGLIVDEDLSIGPFIFSHERISDTHLFNISGHIHPAVKLKGKARQGISLPCFYFSEQYGYLPAFGKFTGASSMNIKKGDLIFAIVENQVLKIPTN